MLPPGKNKSRERKKKSIILLYIEISLLGVDLATETHTAALETK